MPVARVGALDLAYETYGHDDDPALLLIAGLGSPMQLWDAELCLGVADRMFRVIRYDHRDVGLSSVVPGPPYDLGAAMAALGAGEAPPEPPYHLADLVADAIGLLDALGVDAAHVVGVSLGGMIAQQLAIDHPHRVLSLTSVSSSTGEPGVGAPTPDALAGMLEPAPDGRVAVIEQGVRTRRLWATPTEFDEDAVRRYFTEVYDRSHRPEASARHTAAVLLAPDRRQGLERLAVPTLVLHGDADTLVGIDGGRRTAELIPDAELVVLEGMGHDLPAIYWPPIIENITRLAARASR